MHVKIQCWVLRNLIKHCLLQFFLYCWSKASLPVQSWAGKRGTQIFVWNSVKQCAFHFAVWQKKGLRKCEYALSFSLKPNPHTAWMLNGQKRNSKLSCFAISNRALLIFTILLQKVSKHGSCLLCVYVWCFCTLYNCVHMCVSLTCIILLNINQREQVLQVGVVPCIHASIQMTFW